MKELTRAEEEVMHVIWEQEPCTIREVLEHLPEPKPAYTTVATIVRILDTKGVVKHKPVGKTYLYSASISKEAYKKAISHSVVDRFFSGSAKHLVQFFAQKEDVSLSELEEIVRELKNKKS